MSCSMFIIQSRILKSLCVVTTTLEWIFSLFHSGSDKTSLLFASSFINVFLKARDEVLILSVTINRTSVLPERSRNNTIQKKGKRRRCKEIKIYLMKNFNPLRPRQNGRHFADDTFKRIFVNENVRILIEISFKFVPKGPINNIPALVQIMVWRRPGDKPLSEPMMVCLPTHICVTRPQWV